MEWILIGIVVVAVLWKVLASRSPSTTTSAAAIDLSILPERFVVFDLETTGLDPERHKIIEIGAIRVHRDSSRHDTLQSLIKIKGAVPAKITEITGITKEMLTASGEPIETALPEFLEFIGELRLVSFNAPFDMAFLRAAAVAQGRTIENPVSCALDMARRAWPGRKSYTLASLAKDGGLETQNHRALSDCQLALNIYATTAHILRRIE